MTLRLPKPGTGSAWSCHYWTPEGHPAVPLLLSLAPATRRWLFGVPGAGRGYIWTLSSMDAVRDTDAEWEAAGLSLAKYVATGDHNYYAIALPDDADVDRALWLTESPWAVLNTLMVSSLSREDMGDGARLQQEPRYDHFGGFRAWEYTARARRSHANGATAIEAVLRLADQIVGGGP